VQIKIPFQTSEAEAEAWAQDPSGQNRLGVTNWWREAPRMMSSGTNAHQCLASDISDLWDIVDITDFVDASDALDAADAMSSGSVVCDACSGRPR